MRRRRLGWNEGRREGVKPPSPSRGGPGWGWGHKPKSTYSYERGPHPPPNLPLEGGGITYLGCYSLPHSLASSQHTLDHHMPIAYLLDGERQSAVFDLFLHFVQRERCTQR